MTVMSFPRIAVGTMNFGGRTPADESHRIVARALERGTPLFDTANVYGDGESERILGAALKGRRKDALIATKVGLLRRGSAVEGLSASRIREAIDESLSRLGTEWVDLYYLHAPDPKTPFQETLDGIQSLLESGKIRAWGVSNFASWEILEMNAECDRRGMARPAISQVLYNLLVRQLDVEYFGFCRRHPLHTTVYNPLAGGLLSRIGGESAGARLSSNPMYRRRYGSEALAELARRYHAVAQEHGMTLVRLAYAWLASLEHVGSILAGPVNVLHLDEALNASALRLPKEVMDRVDAIHRDFVGTDATYAR